MSVSSQLIRKGGLIRYDKDVFDPTDTRLFDIKWLQESGYVNQSGMGRGGVHALHFKERDIVLRYFLRGGLMRKVNYDRYFRLGQERSRSFREYELLRWMRSQALLVPKPIAALTAPSGLFYRAAIMLERIPQSRTLADILKDGPLQSDIWFSIGETIRQMHHMNVFHADLNCRNVLIDKGERVWLIDFDKSRRRQPGGWTTQNIDRLKRSLLKEQSRAADFHMDDQNWSQLLCGYRASRYGYTDVVVEQA